MGLDILEMKKAFKAECHKEDKKRISQKTFPEYVKALISFWIMSNKLKEAAMKALIITLLAIGFAAAAQKQPTEAPAEAEAEQPLKTEAEQSSDTEAEAQEETPAQKQALCKYNGLQGCTKMANICMAASPLAEAYIACWNGYHACVTTIKNSCEEENPIPIAEDKG